MSRCGMILGTGMSSFSDEASFVHSIPKVLVLREGIEDKMLTRYHANNLCRTPLGLLCLNAGPNGTTCYRHEDSTFIILVTVVALRRHNVLPICSDTEHPGGVTSSGL